MRVVVKLSKHLVFICGILSPLLALALYRLVYDVLKRQSTDLEKDWLFRLTVSTLSMTAPFLITALLAIRDRRRHALLLSGKVGLALAILSLGLAWRPVHDGTLRWKQTRNLAMRDVPAPSFDTVDILGNAERLSDQTGKV